MKNNFILPKEILIASGNKGKFSEISDLLKQVQISPIKVPDNFEEPEEIGVDFAANSLIKAKYYGLKTGFVALADDSGLCIDGLGGAPGVHSARFALDEHGNKNFPMAFEKIFSELKHKGLEPCGSKAHFICNLTIFDPKTDFSISFEGRVDGTLTFPALGNYGFGYDPIFIKNGLTKTFGEISAEEKDKISHRALAFAKLLNYFKNGQTN